MVCGCHLSGYTALQLYAEVAWAGLDGVRFVVDLSFFLGVDAAVDVASGTGGVGEEGEVSEGWTSSCWKLRCFAREQNME